MNANRFQYIEALGQLCAEIALITLRISDLAIEITHKQHPMFPTNETLILINANSWLISEHGREEIPLATSGFEKQFPLRLFQLEYNHERVTSCWADNSQFVLTMHDTSIHCPVTGDTVEVFPKRGPDAFLF